MDRQKDTNRSRNSKEKGKSGQWRQSGGKGRNKPQQQNSRRSEKEEMDTATTPSDPPIQVPEAIPTPTMAAPTPPTPITIPNNQDNNTLSVAATPQTKSSEPEECVDETAIAEEEKLVAARNEENTRASAAAEDPTAEKTTLDTAALKLNYTKDQWSPLNLEGKKKYERDFLMQLKNDPQSMKRPEDLPKLEVVINDQYKNRSNDPRPLGTLNRGGSNADSLLMPKFMSQTPRGSMIKRNSQQGKPKTPKVIQLNLSLNEDVKLNETENAWRPTRMVPTKPEEVIEVEQEDLYKKVRSVLNKLTPQKFDLLVDQVKALPIDTKEKLEGVINLVFEKAVDEPSFSVAYAMMCQTLSNMQVAVAKNKEGSKPNSETVHFKKLLLMRCQAEFEKQRDSKDSLKRDERLNDVEAVDGEKKKDLEMQLEEEERRIRQKYVGVNRFIGELYKRHMLTANIMVQCISKLLEANDEESLECLCKLLTTVGKELETRQDKEKKAVDLSPHFQRMQNIVDGRKVSSRIRFMLQDVIELRADKWRPRRGDSNPKTMDEIAKEAERESLTQLATPPPHSIRSNKDDRDRDRKRGRGVSDGDGWTTAGGGGRVSIPRGPLEINKLKLKHNEMENVNLGSKNQFTWGSKGSGGHKSKSDIAANPGANPFSVLSADTDKPGIVSKDMLSSSATPTSRSSGGSSSRDASSSSETRKIIATATDEAALSSQQPSSRPGSRDSSVMRGEESSKSVPAVSSSKGADVLSEDDLKTRSTLLIDEYLSSGNAQDLLMCVQEEVHPSQVSNMVANWVLGSLEWSQPKRVKTASALVVLCKENLVNHTHLLPALEEISSMTDDLIIDIPMTFRYLAEVTAPLLRCDTLQFSHLREATKLMQPKGGAKQFLLESVKILQKEGGPGWIVPRWKSSDMSWSEFVPEQEVEQFLIDNGLSYFLEGSEKVVSSSTEAVMSPQEMQTRLITLMPESSYDHVVQWITANIGKEIETPKYIRALMTAICTVGIFQDKSQWKLNVDVFHSQSKLLQRYVDAKEPLELQALYAIQAFVNCQLHPSGLLNAVLTKLVEEGILSRDSVLTWSKSDDPAEAEGRGVAVKSVNQLLTWLEEPDDDSPDEAS